MTTTAAELMTVVADFIEKRGEKDDDALVFATMTVAAALMELRDSIDAIPWRDVGRDEPEYYAGTTPGEFHPAVEIIDGPPVVTCDRSSLPHSETTDCVNRRPVDGHP